MTHEDRTSCNNFGYGQGMYEKGRLSWDRSEAEGVVVLRDYDYEWRGLVSQRQDVITRGGSTEYFTTSYEYEPGGAVKKVTYPSGAVVETVNGCVLAASVNDLARGDLVPFGYQREQRRRIANGNETTVQPLRCP